MSVGLSVCRSVCPSHVCYKWVARGGGGGNPLSPNSSETAWNILTKFYRMDDIRLKMVYVNFHKPTLSRDISMTIYIYFRGLKRLVVESRNFFFLLQSTKS